MHALLLAPWPTSMAPMAPKIPPAAASVTTVKTRLLQSPPPTATVIAESPGRVASEPLVSERVHVTAAREPIETISAAPATAEPRASAPESVAEAPREETPPANHSQAVAAIEPDGYVPRPQLTLPPLLLTQVVIPEAPADASLESPSGILALYIDEKGHVRKVEALEPKLPPEYERLVQEAFESARYLPGQVEGRIAKSRIRIEVRFAGGRHAHAVDLLMPLPPVGAGFPLDGNSAAHQKFP
jgi:hypothetical protein